MTFVPPSSNKPLQPYVGLAFGFSPDSDPATWVFTDVTKLVRGSVSLNVGGSAAASQSQPSSIQLSLVNNDGRFTAKNPLSINWPNIVRNVPLQVGITWPGATATYELLTSFVNGWPLQPNAGVLDVTIPITASGRLRRIRRNGKTVLSPQTRAIGGTAPLAWWPMEDGPKAQQAGSGLTGGQPMKGSSVGTPTFGSVEGPGGTAPLPDFSNGGSVSALVPYNTATSYRVEFDLKVPTVAVSDFATAVQILPASGVTNSIDIWEFGVNAPADGGAYLQWFGDGGTAFDFRTTHVTLDDGAWHHVRLDFSSNAGNTQVDVSLDDVAVGGSFAWTTTRAYTPPSRVVAGSAAGGTKIASAGELVIWAPWVGSIDTYDAFTGYAGELADARVERLCAENNIPVTVTSGTDVPAQAMGAQGVDSLGNLLDACASIDNGLLHDAGPRGSLAYVSGAARYNAPAQMTLDFNRSQISDNFAGTYDDQTLVNEWQITRTGGSSSTYDDTDSQAAEGVLSAPDTVDAYTDDQVDDIAAFRTHMSTYDAYRFPAIGIDLRRSPELAQAMLALTLPARIDPINLPSPYPPDDMRQFAEGWSATLDATMWQVSFVNTPYDPWIAGVWDNAKLDSSSSTLAAPVSAGVVGTAGTFRVATALDGDLWTTSSAEWTAGSNGPLYVIVDGEIAQVTNLTSYAKDAYGRTTSAGWGTADIGGGWNISGGTGTDYNITPAVATHLHPSINVGHHSTLGSGVRDFDASIGFKTASGVMATGAPILVSLATAWASTLTSYQFRAQLETSGAVTALVVRSSGGSETVLGSATVPGLTWTTDSFHRIRGRMVGSTLSVKIWHGPDEPGAWHATGVDSLTLLGPGAVGVTSLRAPSNSNTSLLISYEFFEVTNPQTMTVVRGVNGVAIGHAAGLPVHVYQGAVVAL